MVIDAAAPRPERRGRPWPMQNRRRRIAESATGASERAACVRAEAGIAPLGACDFRQIPSKMRLPSQRPHRRRQSKRSNSGPTKKPRTAPRVPHHLARHGYRSHDPRFARRRYAWRAKNPGAGIANAAMGAIDRGARIRPNFRLPAQAPAGYVSESSPAVAAPSLPPSVAGKTKRPLERNRGWRRAFRISQRAMVSDTAASRPGRRGGPSSREKHRARIA